MKSVLKRSLALFLVLTLACSLMTVSAFAYQCNHPSYTITTETPADCTRGGYFSAICDVCGTQFRGTTPALGHAYSEQVVEYPTCSNDGWGQYICDRCGHNGGTYTIPKLGHDLYDAQVTATCTTGGVITHKCTRCSYERNEEVGPLGHDMGPYVIVKEATETEPGLKRSECSRHDKVDEIPYELSKDSLPSGVILLLSESTDPGNGTCYVEGENYALHCTIENHGSGTVRLGTTRMNDNVSAPGDILIEPAGVQLAVGESFDVDTEKTTTSFAVENGAITYWVSLTYTDASGNEFSVSSNEVTIPFGSDVPHSSKVNLSLNVTSSPKNGHYYQKDENVFFRVTAFNEEGEEISSAVLREILFDVELLTFPVIISGSSESMNFVVQVEEWMVEDHWFTEQCVMDYKDASGAPHSVVSNGISIPCGAPDQDPYLNSVITEVSSPVNGSFYVENEEIVVCATYTVTGDKAVYNASDAAYPYAIGAFFEAGSTITAPSASFTRSYTVTAEDAAAGSVSFSSDTTYTTGSGQFGSCASNVLRVPCGFDDSLSGAWLNVVKYDASISNAVYGVGDLVTFTIRGGNSGDADALNVVLTDINTGDTVTYASLPAGQCCYLTATYQITQEDVDRGYYSNAASVTGIDSVTGESLTDFADCEVLCGEKTPPFSIVKEEISAPFSAELGYSIGDTVWYRLTVFNQGDTALNNVTLVDDACGVDFALSPIAPHGSSVHIVSHQVTVEEAEAGLVHNVAYAEAGGNRIYAVLDVRAHVPFGIEEPDNDCFLVKYIMNTPANGYMFTEGEEVVFGITLVNNSDIPILSYAIYEEFNEGVKWEGSYIGPYDSVTVEYRDKITAGDVSCGHFYNSAKAKASHGGEDHDLVADVIGLCGSGALMAGEDCCARTMTASGQSGAEYRQDFCGTHAATRAKAADLLSGRTSEAALLDAYTGIASLWRDDLDLLYSEWTAAVSDNLSLRRMVTVEQNAFYRMIESLDASLNTWNADHPADNARMIAEVLERKAVTLCYELHTRDLTSRPDCGSAASPMEVTAADPANCSRTWSQEDADTFLCTDLLCAAHQKTSSSARTYLSNADTELKQYAGWITLRSSWENALTGSTLPLLDTLSAEGRETVVHAGDAVRSYCSAHYAFLEFLYGKNSPIAAELSAREVQELVILQCALMK